MNAGMNCTMAIFGHDEWQAHSADELLLLLLKRLKHLSFVDNFVFCTNVDRLASLAADTGFLHIPMGLPAVRGPEMPNAFKKTLSAQLHRQLGYVGNVQLSVDAVHLLVEAQTVEDMFDQLMEDSECHEVALGYNIDPHLYVKLNDSLHQIYDHPGMDRQKMPKLFRKVGVAIRHGLRAQLGPKKLRIRPVPWSEIMTYDPMYHDFFEEQAAAMEIKP
jgi:hypothetical protein